MKNKDFEITRSDYLLAIKFGEVDNSDFATDFFQSVMLQRMWYRNCGM